MNVSISYFRVSSISNIPLLSGSLYRKSSNFHFSDIFAKNFFSHFFISSDFGSKHVFRKCKFSKFLNTAVQINSDRFTDTRFKFPQVFSSNSTASFKQCLFINCNNAETKGKGGGFFYYNVDGRILLQECLFNNCSADFGGAFASKCRMYTIQSCCVTNCFCFDKYSTFRIYGTVQKNSDNENCIIDQSSICGNGPSEPLQERILLQINDINTHFDNTNISHSKAMSRNGFVKVAHKFVAPEVDFKFSAFTENEGPGLISITQPFEKSQNFPTFDSCNFVSNTPGALALIIITEDTRCGFKSCVFSEHNQQEMKYFAVSKTAAVLLNKCSSDSSIEDIKGVISGRFRNSSCSFDLVAPSLNVIEAVPIDSCFESAITATFTAEPTKVKKKIINDEKKTLAATLTFTASPNLYPRTVMAQQYALYIVIGVGIPFFYLLHIMKKRQISGRLRRVRRHPKINSV